MNSSRTHYLKLIGGIIGALIVLAGIAIATIFLLKNIAPQHEANNAATTPPALSAADAIKTYTAKAAIKALSEAAYDQQSGDSTEIYIFYKSTNQPYAINVKASDRVRYVAKDQSQADDTKVVQSQTETLLVSKGFKKVTQPTKTGSSLYVYTTFENDSTICQLSDTPSSTGVIEAHSFACVAKSVITQEYATIAKLFDLYKKSNTLGAVTDVNRTTTTEGNKSLTIIGATKADGYLSLLFAAIDNNWEYIANLNDGNSANSNGKYTLTPTLQAALNNPKYGDFLKKNIG